MLNAHRTGQKVKINVPSLGDEYERKLAEGQKRLDEAKAKADAEEESKRLRAEERQRRKS